jgi:predicted DsbA family dithiol-disulfide isomerase
MKTLRVSVWSDIACPWCFVGKRRLESALAAFPERGKVRVVWRAFELDPAAPRIREGEGSYAERLARKYGISVERARDAIARMLDVGAQDGIAFDFENIRPGNTFDAHRVLYFARQSGQEEELKERYLRAYLCEGAAIGDPAVLASLAAQVGMDVDRVSAVLASNDFSEAVRAEEEQARRLGIHGVPFFVFDDRYGVSGAQPVETLLGVLEHTWREVDSAEEFAAGATCGPDGC